MDISLNTQNITHTSGWSKSAFSVLSSELQQHLRSNISCFEISRGSLLNKKGSPADGAYCILEGHAKITWPENGGRESIVKIVAPGDMTGYRCLFSEECFRATAVALGDIKGFFVGKDLFNYFLDNSKAFNKEILCRMGKEVRLSEQRLHSFCQKNVRERMAEALVLLKDICGVEINQGQWLLDINLSREELSSWIGTAKETAVRCLTDMKKEGVITPQNNFIIITNLSALKNIASLS